MSDTPTPDQVTAAADRIDAYLAAWNEYLGHWAATSDFIAGGPSNDAPDLMRPDLLVVLAAARATARTTAATTCPVTAPSVFTNQPPLSCVLPAEPAHEWHRAASGAKWSPNAQAAMTPPAPETYWTPADDEGAGDEGQDDEDRPWTLAELTDHLRRQNPDADARVIREVTRRMAAQMSDVKQLDAGLVAHDLRHTLAALAVVAHELVSEWMSDLADDEKPHGVDGLADALNACAFVFAEIHGTF